MKTTVSEPIGLKHGAGGRAMRSLIENVLIDGMPKAPPGGVGLAAMDDGAAIPIGDRFLVITTDSHVVKPYFFPGGDIGKLAVSGTVNDLAMMGATDVVGLTCSVILEEGFAREELERIQTSLRETCTEANAPIVTGDTKVMGRGEIDGIVLNTCGVALTDRVVTDSGLRAGDRLLVTGTIGDHGLAVMVHRHGLDLDGELDSDVAPLNGLVRRALEAGGEALVAMKDPTRGGLASVLHEMAYKSGVGILIEENEVPVSTMVRSASELLGIDPMHVANEGKAVVGVRAERARDVLEALKSHPLGQDAALVGVCLEEHVGSVIVDTGFGRRLLSEIEGEPLPRIC